MTGQTLVSSWSGEDDCSVLDKAPQTRQITFETIRCEPEGTEGHQILVQDFDPSDAQSILDRMGKIEVKPLILSVGDRGRSKDVFKVRWHIMLTGRASSNATQLVINDDLQLYVAKHFFDVGKGRGVVSCKANKSLLSRDLIRIGRMRYFYNQFVALAAEKGFNELASTPSDIFLRASVLIYTCRRHNHRCVHDTCRVGPGGH